jgi:hypothetical protein
MTRRKTEAWLVEWADDGQFFGLFRDKATALISVDQSGSHQSLRITPLVRRDPKAEAVVRAAEKLVRWWEEMGTACNPHSANADPADRVMSAVDALLASRKRAKR